MNENIKKLTIFTAGLIIGSAVSYFICNKKFEDKFIKELDSELEKTREYEKNKENKTIDNKTEEDFVHSEQETNENITLNKFMKDLDSELEKTHKRIVHDYSSPAIKSEVTNNRNKSIEEEGEEVDYNKPYVISPDEFGEDLDYETVSLTYYADGVLTDDFGNIIENRDELIGEESLNTFGEYEDDSVFVRNDALKIDYEILADLNAYSEVYSTE